MFTLPSSRRFMSLWYRRTCFSLTVQTWLFCCTEQTMIFLDSTVHIRCQCGLMVHYRRSCCDFKLQTSCCGFMVQKKVDVDLWYRRICCDFMVQTKLLRLDGIYSQSCCDSMVQMKLLRLSGTDKAVVTLWYIQSWCCFTEKTKMIWFCDTANIIFALWYRRSSCDLMLC